MTAARTVLCIGLALLAPCAGLAQTEVPLGSHIPRPVETRPLTKTDANSVRERFVTCVYEKQPAKVDALLDASDILKVDYERAGVNPKRVGRILGMEACLGRATSITDSDLTMRMSFPTLRAMLLEQSYRVNNPTPPAWLASARSTPQRRFASTDDALDRARVYATFSDCVVAAAPREADALIRTPAGSAAEKASIKPLIPHLAACIPAGQDVRFDASRVRALVADGLWATWRSATRPAAAVAR